LIKQNGRKEKMKRKLLKLGSLALVSTRMWALGGGRMMATQAIGGLSSEVAGPLAYGLALIATVGGAVSWYRHSHDSSALQTGVMGTLFVGGVALGASSLLGFIPGVAGAVI
jgi:hypothetical protein